MSTLLRSLSRFLVEYVHLLPRGSVVDVAAGSGRNTLSLAEPGFTVHAIDRNPEALRELQITARDRHLMHVTTAVVDLEGEPFPHQVRPQATYDVVIVFFYLFRPLFPALVRTLKPGGVLLYETFLIDNSLRYQRPRHPDWEELDAVR
jgi:SAM-dependent methyltransferase